VKLLQLLATAYTCVSVSKLKEVNGILHLITSVLKANELYVQLAMVKNQRLAEKLFDGNIYDCICKFEPISSQYGSDGRGL
jgi:hypothetical protein